MASSYYVLCTSARTSNIVATSNDPIIKMEFVPMFANANHDDNSIRQQYQLHVFFTRIISKAVIENVCVCAL